MQISRKYYVLFFLSLFIFSFFSCNNAFLRSSNDEVSVGNYRVPQLWDGLSDWQDSVWKVQ